MNRECVVPGGAGIYPLQGDVKSSAGNNTVVVTGLNGVALGSQTLVGGQVHQYNPATNNWEPTLRATVQVNSITVSDDPYISVNVTKPVLVNGA